MPPLAVSAGYVLLILLWGSTWAAIKIGVEAVPPFVFAFERAVAVSCVLIALSLAMRLPFPRDRRVIAAAVVVGVVNTGSSWAIIFWSEQFVPSGLVSVFGASSPIWTALLAHFLVQGDRLSALKITGLVLGLAGIAVLVGAPAAGSRPEAVIASVLLAIMPMTWSVGTILQARVLRQGSPLPLVAVGTCAGTLVLLPFAAAQAGETAHWTTAAVLAFAYLVIFGSCVGLVLQMWLTRSLRPTTMTLAQVVIPAQALLIGALVLGESITWRMVLGAAMVVVAVALNTLAGGGTRPEPAAVASPAD
ncbi:MAG TPA: EamA family transporter [Candidatus Limnocylindria bacterium]|nr:EamA family transporter [Candidatus Limnocylindria bacterium]